MKNRAQLMTGLLSLVLGLMGCPNNNETSATSPPPIFVSAAIGMDDVDCGLTWADACATIQMGGDRAVAMGQDRVFVAAGTYVAAMGNSSVLTMADDVSYYGGFVGTEAALADRSDPALNPSILDGDFAQDDPAAMTDNSLHVVIGADDSMLDGFTIRGGRADSTSPRGAGMLNESIANVTINLVESTGNVVTGSASAFGGAIYNRDVDAFSLTNVNFTDNMVRASQTGRGGAIYSEHTTPSTQVATISNVNFNNNGISSATSIQQGGALFIDDAGLTLADVTFSSNWVNNGSGGAVYAVPTAADLTFTDVSFSSNTVYTSGDGGGLFVSGPPTVTASLTDVIFSNNYVSSSGGGGGMFADGVTVAISDTEFTRNSVYAGSGGGLHVNNGMQTLNRVAFTSNSISNSGGFGGGLHAEDSTITMSQVSFLGNRASGSSSYVVKGGGASILNTAATLSDVSFRRNSAFGSSASGGGLAAQQSTLTGTNVVWADNRIRGNSDAYGGALSLDETPSTLTNISFSDNSAMDSSSSAEGAAIQIDGVGIVSITNTTFAGHGPSSSFSRPEASEAIHVTNSGTLIGTNVLFGDNADDIVADSGATVTISSSCSDLDLSAVPNATIVSPTMAGTDPTVRALTGEVFMDPVAGCLSSGDDASADTAYAPEDWRTMTTQLDKALDGGLVDPGMHYALDKALWIDSLAIDMTAMTWSGNFPAESSCEYAIYSAGPDVLGVLTGSALDAGTFDHMVPPPGYSLDFTCTFNGMTTDLSI